MQIVSQRVPNRQSVKNEQSEKRRIILSIKFTRRKIKLILNNDASYTIVARLGLKNLLFCKTNPLKGHILKQLDTI